MRSLLWNADGSMLGKYIFKLLLQFQTGDHILVLATAGDDNMLNIWNFFGYSELGPAKSDSKRKCVSSKLMLGNPSLFR